MHNSWFRLSNRICEDHEFFDFDGAELKAWIYILCLASQKNHDTVQVFYQHATHVCKLSKTTIDSTIKKLTRNKCIEVLRKKNERGRYVGDTPTGATRHTEHNRTEQESTTEPASPLPALATIWNQNCGDRLAKVRKTNSGRTKLANRILGENSPEEWGAIVSRIAASDFCCGLSDRGWRATFAWLLKPSTHLKVSEGEFDNRKTQGLKPAGGICGVAE